MTRRHRRSCGSASWPGQARATPRSTSPDLRLLPAGEDGCLVQNRIWRKIVTLACELIGWTEVLALDGAPRRWGIRFWTGLADIPPER